MADTREPMTDEEDEVYDLKTGHVREKYSRRIVPMSTAAACFNWTAAEKRFFQEDLEHTANLLIESRKVKI